ncbi:hypothetical protein C8Q75DRAFT_306662 [Abortiporus biennis]|nr:hypothetical protein C8Q75DRAFT_306662 [Abortiporus biennis]
MVSEIRPLPVNLLCWTLSFTPSSENFGMTVLTFWILQSQHSSAMLSSLIVYVRHFIHFVRTPNIQPPIHMICFVTMEFPTRPESFSGVGKRAKPCKHDFVTKEMRNLLTSSTSTRSLETKSTGKGGPGLSINSSESYLRDRSTSSNARMVRATKRAPQRLAVRNRRQSVLTSFWDFELRDLKLFRTMRYSRDTPKGKKTYDYPSISYQGTSELQTKTLG